MKNSPKLIILILIIPVVLLISAPSEEPLQEKITDGAVGITSVQSQAQLSENAALISSIPEIPANLDLQSAMVKNIGSNFYFLQLNTDYRWPMASLTKLLTAVVALENLEKTTANLDLIKSMMIISDNQAAETLAAAYGSEKFLELMRYKASELQMDQTSIFDATGLSFLNQSTVKDLEKLANYIVKRHPQILQYSREKAVIIDGQSHPNINQFAGLVNFIGGKTGYTDEAHGNLLSIFEHQGQPILIIALGATDRLQRFEQTQILYQWISQFYK